MEWILYGGFVIVVALVAGFAGYMIRDIQLQRTIKRLVHERFKREDIRKMLSELERENGGS